jgi:hypothetical protein
MKLSYFFYLLLSISLVSAACNEPTLVGSDLLSDEGINLVHMDTLSIEARTIKRDSVVTNSDSYKLSSLLCGEMDDPIFGKSRIEAYFDLHLNGTKPQFTYIDDMENEQFVLLDSIVLVLKYDTTALYGSENAKQDLQVFILQESIPESDTVYSNLTLETEPIPVGELNNFIVSGEDTLEIYQGGDTLEVFGQLRVPLDESFGNMLIQDTAFYDSDTLFTEKYKGLKIVSTPLINPSVLAFDMFYSTSLQYNSVILYYSTDEGSGAYQFDITGDWFHNFSHDYSGYPVEEGFDDFEFGDSLLFAQSMEGMDIELTFPTLSKENLGNVIINKSELELTVAELPGDNIDVLTPFSQFIVSRYNENGEKVLTEDAGIAFNIGNLSGVLGGTPYAQNISGIDVNKYKINVTNHVINVLREEGYDSKLLLSRYLRQERADRVVIFGPGHSVYPLKLNIIYSIN